MMFAVSVPFLFSDGNENEGTIGASTTLAITDATTFATIENAVLALSDGDVLTITGSKDFGTTDNTSLYLIIPEGATVIWDAYFRSYGGLQIGGDGSFKANAGKLDLGGIFVGIGTPTMTLNGNIDLWGKNWGSGPYSGILTINGNLTISGENHIFESGHGAEVIINGNVNVTGGAGTGESEGCIAVCGGGVMTINGSFTPLSDDEYVMIEEVWFSKDAYADVSSKEGYREYTDGTSSVFVKILPDDSGSNILLIAVAAIAVLAIIGVVAYVFIKKKP